MLASGCYRLHFYIVFYRCLNNVLEDHLSRYFAHQELISIGKGCPKLKYYARPFRAGISLCTGMFGLCAKSCNIMREIMRGAPVQVF